MEHQDFLDYARRIVEEGEQRGVQLRLLGAVAFYLHCPKYGSFQHQANRHFTDLDFAAYFSHNDAIRSVLASLRFQEDREVAVVYARQRLVFDHVDLPLHIDVFFDKLDFCHPIPWAGRLEKDKPDDYSISAMLGMSAYVSQQMGDFAGAELTHGDVTSRFFWRAGRPIDLLLIDGDHRIQGCAADFDALASMLGAYLLDDSAIPVLPRRMNRNVRAFVTLYGAELPFVDPRDLPTSRYRCEFGHVCEILDQHHHRGRWHRRRNPAVTRGRIGHVC